MATEASITNLSPHITFDQLCFDLTENLGIVQTAVANKINKICVNYLRSTWSEGTRIQPFYEFQILHHFTYLQIETLLTEYFETNIDKFQTENKKLKLSKFIKYLYYVPFIWLAATGTDQRRRYLPGGFADCSKEEARVILSLIPNSADVNKALNTYITQEDKLLKRTAYLLLHRQVAQQHLL